MPDLKDLSALAEDQDALERDVSRLALRLVYDIIRPHIGSGAKELTGDDADRLLAATAEIIATLVRANRFRVAGAICLHLHTALGPTPPCSAATCSSDPSGQTACPTGPDGSPDCTGCPAAGQKTADQEDDGLVQVSRKKPGGRKD